MQTSNRRGYREFDRLRSLFGKGVQTKPHPSKKNSSNKTSRYILHASSGPFVDQNLSHHNIAFSCIAYLRTSLLLIDPATSGDTAQLMVVNGFHGLHSYADDYWFHHLVRHIQSEGGLWSKKSVHLVEELQGLLVAQKPPGVASVVPEISSTKAAQDWELDSISAHLEDFPAIQHFLHVIVIFRDKLVEFQKTESYDDGQYKIVLNAQS